MKSILYKIACSIYIRVSRIFDLKRGKDVDFAQWVSQKELELAEDEGNQYMPSTFELKSVLRKLKITDRDKILDIGCGKGKAMYMMHSFPFSAIRGIDLSQELVRTANDNFKILKCDRCEAICANALEYEEYDKYSMFYFYNPFPEKVFQQVIDMICMSYEKTPRRITIVYMNPVCEKAIENTKIFEKFYSRKSLISWFTINCYRTR